MALPIREQPAYKKSRNKKSKVGSPGSRAWWSRRTDTAHPLTLPQRVAGARPATARFPDPTGDFPAVAAAVLPEPHRFGQGVENGAESTVGNSSPAALPAATQRSSTAARG